MLPKPINSMYHLRINPHQATEDRERVSVVALEHVPENRTIFGAALDTTAA